MIGVAKADSVHEIAMLEQTIWQPESALETMNQAGYVFAVASYETVRTDATVQGNAITRELAMVKVVGTGDKRVEALRIAARKPDGPRRIAVVAPVDAPELEEADLEHVVGGLERVYVSGPGGY